MAANTIPIRGDRKRDDVEIHHYFNAPYAVSIVTPQRYEKADTDRSGEVLEIEDDKDVFDFEDVDPISTQPFKLRLEYSTEIVLSKDPILHPETHLDALPCWPQSLLDDKRRDPFNSFPLQIDDLQAHLIDFYVHDFARTNLQYSAKFQPGMRYFREVMGSLVELHAILSQAALGLLYAHKSHKHSPRDYRQLEMAALRHKGQTISAINQGLDEAVSQQVMSATLSLARDEAKYGNPEIAAVHLQAFRQMMQSIGGRDRLTLPHLLVQVRGFECNQPRPELSALFDPADLPARVELLRKFLSDLHRVGTARCQMLGEPGLPRGTINPASQVLRLGSIFHHLVAKEYDDVQNLVEIDMSERHAQMAILIGIAAAWLHARDLAQVREWLDWRNTMLVVMGIGRTDSVKNAQNLLQAGMNTRRATEMAHVWFPMELFNATRYLSKAWKTRLRDWLVRLLEGFEPEPFGELDPFAFSYV